MREREVSKKLQLLQSVQPNMLVLYQIRKRISAKKQREQKFSMFALLTAVIVLTFIITIIYFPFTINKVLASLEVAIATNQYDKAKIAVAYADSQFSLMKKNQFKKRDIKPISQSLALANTEMDGLKLMGEKGKYTSLQCLSLYIAYHDSLEAMEKAMAMEIVSSQDEHTQMLLLAELKKYDEQSERKIHKYKK